MYLSENNKTRSLESEKLNTCEVAHASRHTFSMITPIHPHTPHTIKTYISYTTKTTTWTSHTHTPRPHPHPHHTKTIIHTHPWSNWISKHGPRTYLHTKSNNKQTKQANKQNKRNLRYKIIVQYHFKVRHKYSLLTLSNLQHTIQNIPKLHKYFIQQNSQPSYYVWIWKSSKSCFSTICKRNEIHKSSGSINNRNKRR